MATAVDAAARPEDPPHLKVAFSKLGLKEVPGTDDNPLIVGMFARIGRADILDDETSWCAGFVGWCLVEAGIPSSALPPKAGRLLARSYLAFGRRLDAPLRGAIVVFARGNSSWQGHVAFFLRFVPIDGRRYAEVIGGNQSDAVTIARYPADRVLGFRWPDGVPLPRSATAAIVPSARTPPAASRDGVGTAAGGLVVAVGTGSVAAAGAGVPWWAILAGIALCALGAAALIFFLTKRG